MNDNNNAIKNDIKQAKKYKRKILEYYKAVNLKMGLYFVRKAGDRFVFLIEFKPGTTEKKIRQFLGDVRQALGLQLFQLHRDNLALLFIASETNRSKNQLLSILKSSSYPEYTKNMKIPYSIGFDTVRRPVVVDLVLYLNWLLVGASFSGKTTGIQCLISSILWSCSPQDINLVIIDVAANLTQFAALPHLSCPVIQDANAGYNAIISLRNEMMRRFNLKNESLEEFNLQPFIVCIIDECVSFVSGTSDKQKSQTIADTISHILRLGRHAKIYLVLATQNAAVNKMKCDLSSITSRIAFKCGKSTNSVTILGEGGAEKLAGRGEMYFKSQYHSGLMRVKGAHVTKKEIECICNEIRAKYEKAEWDSFYKFSIDPASLLSDDDDADYALTTGAVTSMHGNEDKIFAKIIMWTFRRKTVSANAISQEFCDIGSRRASSLVEKMEKLSIAGKSKAKLGRVVLPTSSEDLLDKVLNLLNRHGYTAEEIDEAFNAKQKDEEKGLGITEERDASVTDAGMDMD